MLNKSVARRYAEAFFSIAQEAGKIDDYQTELSKIVQSIEEIEGLKKYFAHPLVPTNEKKDIAKQLFSSKVSSVTLNFLLLVLDKKRQTYLELIYKEYEEMADESHGIRKADVVSAMAVPDAEVDALAKTLSSSSGKTIQLNLTIDPALLGGIKIRMGDKIIDASVAKKLEMLKKNLKTAKIS
jgi:F-type H+-transporting ATPase subunit delta